MQECVEGTSAGGNFARGAGEEVDVGTSTTGGVGEAGVDVDGENGRMLGEKEIRREDLGVFLGSAGGDMRSFTC